MNDLICINQLEIFPYIGVPDEERKQQQRLLVTVKVEVNSISKAARSHDISATLNYYDLSLCIKNLALSRPRKLVETLAEEIAEEVLKSKLVKAVTVELEKFILPDTRSISIRIHRKKKKTN